MHLEATAVGLGDKLTAILGPSLAILWVMLKLGRAMVGHEATCQILFGHVVGFVSQSALPQKHQDSKQVLSSYVLSLRVKILGPGRGQVGHLGPFLRKLQLCFLGQSWGILKASWAIGRSC